MGTVAFYTNKKGFFSPRVGFLITSESLIPENKLTRAYAKTYATTCECFFINEASKRNHINLKLKGQRKEWIQHYNT